MPSYLLKTKKALEDSEDHLRTAGAFGTSIESYLTQHILILLCAEMQQEIYKISSECADRHKNSGLTDYVTNSSNQILRSANRHKIADFIALFGPTAKDTFVQRLSTENIEAYNNAVANRVKVAHKHGAQVTISDLKDAFDRALKVLDAVEAAISKAV